MAQAIHRIAWAVTKGSDEKDHWTRIGRSFLNKDGSETILLDAAPLSGKLILRDKKMAPVEEPAA
jgi:hypothetical protein